ncbi:DNA topoisomerase VI subunit B [Candidatus Micrarchaeota archaeon]|nr:DNA topoisomerase VI subunit B [Candidatus Micrarchaeota archaeon]
MVPDVTAPPISADELSKEFKVHSVAEFFKKNKQMLGLVGKIRTLTTIVHEYTTNSVTWDTPTVIRTNDGVRIARIGEVVDGAMNTHEIEYSNNGEVESLREFPKFEVLCFDKETNKLKLKEVKSLHRHPMKEDEKIFKINLVGGRSVEATKHHSLFTLRNGRVEAIKAEDMKVGDYAVVPRKAWIGGGQCTVEINLIEEALRLSDGQLGGFSVFGVRKILFGDKGLMNEIKAGLPAKERQYGFYNKYMKCDRLPIKMLRRLPPEKRKLFYSCEVGARHSKHHLPAIMPVGKELMQFLGLYAAEGNTRKTLMSTSLSFGSHEGELIEFSKELVERVFGFSPLVRPAHGSATNVTLNSMTAAFLISKIFRCGSKAREKRVPDIVFNVPQDFAREFLLAYLAGDGYPSAKLFECIQDGKFEVTKKITAATASEGLATGLQYLLSTLGYSYSFQKVKGEKRAVNNVETVFGESYRIEFYTAQKNSPLNFYPIERGGISAITESQLKWAINARNQKILMIDKVASLAIKGANVSKEAVAFCNGDLGVLQVTGIETRESKAKEYVYDYSVDGDENFVGGYGAICLHNSLDACEEAKILPDVEIKIEELGNEYYEITVKDNGPGLTRDTVGRAFGQLLAGTKFHRMMQMRGQQGIGCAGCTMLSQMTTGQSTKIITGTDKGRPMSLEVTIDPKKNEPKIENIQELKRDFRGTAVKARFKDVKYINSEQAPLEYLRRTAIANPHARIKFTDPFNETTIFERTLKSIPEKPLEMKPHPKGITVDEIITYARATDARKTSSFLKSAFDRMGDKAISEISSNVSFDMNKDPKQLNWDDASEIVAAFKKVDFIAPRTDGLRPIGEERVKKSLQGIVKPEFMSVIVRKPQVYSGGFPFQVEVAIAYGGEAGRAMGTDQEGNVEKRIEVMRFANRAPLLFDGGGCAITKAVNSVDWKRYGIKDMENAPITVFVNFISVHVPYTGAGKQAIAEEPEVLEELRLALMESGRRTGKFIVNKMREKQKQMKREMFYKYIPEIAMALSAITTASEKALKKNLEDLVLEKLKLEDAEDEEEVKEEVDETEKATKKNLKKAKEKTGGKGKKNIEIDDESEEGGKQEAD